MPKYWKKVSRKMQTTTWPHNWQHSNTQLCHALDPLHICTHSYIHTSMYTEVCAQVTRDTGSKKRHGQTTLFKFMRACVCSSLLEYQLHLTIMRNPDTHTSIYTPALKQMLKIYGSCCLIFLKNDNESRKSGKINFDLHPYSRMPFVYVSTWVEKK